MKNMNKTFICHRRSVRIIKKKALNVCKVYSVNEYATFSKIFEINENREIFVNLKSYSFAKLNGCNREIDVF